MDVRFDNSVALRSIRSGDVFWESESGKDACLIAVEDARSDKDGTHVQACDVLTGDAVRLFEAHRSHGYGLRLYTQPQYTRPDWSTLLAGLAQITKAQIKQAHEAATERLAVVGHDLRWAQEALKREQAKSTALAAQVQQLEALIKEIDAISMRGGATGLELQTRIQAAIKRGNADG